MNSLFASFDSNGVLNWVVPLVFLGSLVVPSYWLMGGVLSVGSKVFLASVYRDIRVLFYSGGGYIYLGLFLFIFLSNFLGLFPYVFTSTSHVCVTLALALPLWVGSQIYGWGVNTLSSFAHLVPEGAPSFLIPLLVVIELISSLIRPLTLSVRLMANMVAGHLLLSLLGGGAALDAPLSVLVVVGGVMAMLFLELGVSLIQGYVFMLLSSLYTVESVY
uniref:ATP synthase subunit a n=1 Tax=Pandarus rhincodonicus TaxID=1473543 RepID=A0A024J3U7_PANRH|nr:ATP synthase F0 subunit 6 [Pandarus rhincodonicus]